MQIVILEENWRTKYNYKDVLYIKYLDRMGCKELIILKQLVQMMKSQIIREKRFSSFHKDWWNRKQIISFKRQK